MQDQEMFNNSRIGRYYKKLFVPEIVKCEWLIQFIITSLADAKSQQVQEFYLQLLREAYAWKRRIQT